MLERKIATYDKTNFRKRLNEFLEVAKVYKQDDLNEHNIYQVLYKTEQFRNAIYKCIKLKRWYSGFLTKSIENKDKTLKI